MTNFFKRTIKKIYKAGFFHSFTVEPGYFCFLDCHGNKYVIQKDPKRFGYWFRIGKVYQWKEQGLTHESDYKSIGTIERAIFNDFFKPVHTNNPDYILRASLNSLLTKFD